MRDFAGHFGWGRTTTNARVSMSARPSLYIKAQIRQNTLARLKRSFGEVHAATKVVLQQLWRFLEAPSEGLRRCYE